MKRVCLVGLWMGIVAVSGGMDSGYLSLSSSIPISIRNEVDVAVENGRQYLEAQQGEDGLWELDGRRSSLPAFAFLEGALLGEEPFEPLQKAFQTAFKRLASRLSYVQKAETLAQMAEDSLIVSAALAVHGEKMVIPKGVDSSVLLGIQTRMRMISTEMDSPTTAWLARMALDLLPGKEESPRDWERLYRGLAQQAEPTPKEVAIAGYARVRRGLGADSESALCALIRWLKKNPSIDPEALYLQSIFLDSLSDGLVQQAGMPLSWRSEMAQRLVSSARSAPVGSCWGDPNDLRATVFAIATLVLF